jgi:GalNAc-alpha-(1->4)-GalNAc-alpha-(1->3)-diNAcBac-PP-undecaprenol alpha-1,4-N-acetyl-D-galactosaminyltransferase
VNRAAPRTRILLLINHDGLGGVERRLAMLADAFEAAGVSCTFVAIGACMGEHGWLSRRSVHVLDEASDRALWRSARRWWRLRRLLSRERFHVVLTFGRSANALGPLAAVGTGQQVILNEIVSPYIRWRRWWNRTAMWSYRLADVLVVQTHRLAEDMQRRSPVPPRTIVIPNPIHPSTIAAPPTEPREPVILGLGRLVAHKRYRDLITAFARIATEFPAWRLRIIGDGPERLALRALADQLGIAARVDLPGGTTTPSAELLRASVLVHCSEMEGFCNTILEGLASGCAVVASDCPYSPREILGNGEGLLYPVGDIEALCAHLRHLLGNEPSRTALALKGHASTDRFGLEENIRQWLSLIAPTPSTPP